MLGIYGTFSVTPTANVGDLIEIKDITPNEGYEAGRAYYTLDTNSEEITIVNNKFYMPAGDVRVIVEFNPITYTIEYELNAGEFKEGVTVVSTYNIKTTSFTLPIDIFSGMLNRYKDSFRYNVVLTHKQKYEK